jgi:hypothetical protein
MKCTYVLNRSGVLLATIDDKTVEVFVGSAYGAIYFDNECPTPAQLDAVSACKNIHHNQFASMRATMEKIEAIKQAAKEYGKFKAAFFANQNYKKQLQESMPKRPYRIA